MNVRIDFNEPKIIAKVQNDRFGLLVSAEWKRLIDPYTPRDTGLLQDTAKIYPWIITYDAKSGNGEKSYATRIYYGKGFNFKNKNPYSTYEWDVAAATAGQIYKLTRTLNNALRSNQF